MKTSLNKMLLLALISLMTMPFLSAQDLGSDKIVYRVTAFKKGNSNMFSVSNTVEITPPVSVYIPNAFTPDGDGLNDIFIPVGKGITEYTLQIFDRWGELIFQSSDFNKGWDGTYKSEPVPMGSYVYKISAKGNGSRIIEKNGSITVVLAS